MYIYICICIYIYICIYVCIYNVCIFDKMYKYRKFKNSKVTNDFNKNYFFLLFVTGVFVILIQYLKKKNILTY